MDSDELTVEEKAAIAALKRVAKKWPKSLWLYSASGSLCVMKKNADGKRELTGGDGSGYDSANVVASVTIENDGGDW